MQQNTWFVSSSNWQQRGCVVGAYDAGTGSSKVGAPVVGTGAYVGVAVMLCKEGGGGKDVSRPLDVT
eukprot:CAMPEP_0114252366 /NCGR_PEP_ID=MMETSP0058-20121206/15795_1 /TAXON_ID=36894 /ORGANISM="Pyramimonas parkeae, CCMP726" /LENGTH=66 /DNA_ID=CAMNT_0001366289 /DNA_START=595 /DNA_END=795 /DNA_ORIENTATION=-